MKKTLYALLICTTLTVSLPALSVSSLAAPAETTTDRSIETSSDVMARKPVTEWRYKVRDYMIKPTKNGLLTGFHVRRNKKHAKETTFSENYKPRTGDPSIIMAHGSSAYRI